MGDGFGFCVFYRKQDFPNGVLRRPESKPRGPRKKKSKYISWLSYDSLHVELPDGYLYFMPIVNWGRYREENGRLLMPVSVRLNHAVADGYLVAKVFLLLKKEIDAFCS